MTKLAIIGGGSWGTALAMVLAPRFELVTLWVYEADLAERMARSRENDVFLPGSHLPDSVQIATELPIALEGADIVLGVMPSHHARGIYTAMLPDLNASMILVSATKGLEQASLLRMSEVIGQVVLTPHVAVLSGPTFAREVAAGNPTAVVVASSSPEVARCVQEAFSGPTFRLYTNADPVGVEVGAALKNVIAIGAGICEGLGLGHNPTAALITRGLAEITRLAIAMGGQAKTLAGLAGLGDLVLTCSGDLSRNRYVGKELGAGKPLAEILGSMRMVAEGVETCASAVALGQKLRVDLPIIQQMHAVLSAGKSPKEAVRDLMDRSLKGE
ncbi:MAG TPA: NAD(P)H-dependent glycerol-3-phosphate dehydrogenase [Bryobacteraceae bacterium]|jgi:glycerol-3-phosphate dehydrogenase (NAD(P)+)|nr:NAD(P)H-dependent glycerol-3-phosphate dehydrogenase [Bryobacteraceae bacterium]